MSYVYNHEQGYDVVLLDPAKSGLMCSECDLVLRDAVLTMEGNRLCLPCFKKIEKSPGYKSSKTGISILDENGKPGWYPDKAVRREVMQLKVKCHNCTFGCPWTGHLLQYFEAHQPGCKYKPVSCPNEGCKEMILPVDLKKHQTSECMHRNINCQYCNQATKPVELEGHHEACTNLPVKCSHCDSLIPRDEMDDHNLKDCPKVEFNCGQVTQLAKEEIMDDNQKGYDVVLAEQEKGLQCSECDLVLRNAVQTCEGIRLCRPCYEKIASLPGGRSPKTGIRVLNENGKRFCYADKSARREVSNLVVTCKFGCLWNGPISYYEEHCEVCPCRLVSCPACNKQIFQGQMEDHECSRYRCICGEMFDKKDENSIDSHLSKPGVIYKHLERLSSEIAKKDREHKAELIRLQCMIEMKQCFQQNVQSHDQSTTTSQTAVDNVENSQRRSSELELQLQASLASTHNGSFLWRIPDISRRRRENVQSHDQSTTTSQTAVDSVENSQRRWSELELQLQASLASTHNGSFLWRIPDISRRRRDAIEERITSIYSPPFYTGRNGYKMCIRAYLNGDGMGYKTHLSLFFVVMKGEFDALLKWPFDYKVSLILVDQNHRKHIVQTFKPTPESNSFQRPVSDMNVASGYPQFSKLSVLDDTSYVKDDVLSVRCKCGHN